MVPKLLPIDMDYVQDVMLRLLRTPSPAGRTDRVMHLIGEEVEALGLPFELTRRGVLLATLRGEQYSLCRALVVHADTTGAMVRRIADNGRPLIAPVGTFSPRFAEGARVQLLTDDPDRTYTGTILPLKASGHAFDTEVDTQPVAWTNLEVRLDEPVETAQDTADLGIRIGDFVALDAAPCITPSGYVNARHLDDKAGVAVALGAVRALVEADVRIPVTTNLLVTIAEEVGLGATHGLQGDVAEAVSIDNAVCAPGQASRETHVNVAMLDSAGPFDYHLSRRLLTLCEQLEIPSTRDVFNYYRSDTASALEAGAEMRAALVGFGVDGSHGYERTHLDGLRRVAELIAAYFQTPLTFRSDTTPRTSLESFPEQDQPPDA